MRSASMRASASSSSILRPRESTYRNRPREPRRFHPPRRAIEFRCSRASAVLIPKKERGPMAGTTIVVLEGDETGQELLEEALRVLAPDVTGLELRFPRFDLSLASRRGA